MVLNSNIKYIEAVNINLKVLSSSTVIFKPDVSFDVIDNSNENSIFSISMGALDESSKNSFATDQNERLILGVFKIDNKDSNITFQVLKDSIVSYNMNLIPLNESTKSF
jgi:hypothetical protein